MKQSIKLLSESADKSILKYAGILTALLSIVLFSFISCGATDNNNDALSDLEEGIFPIMAHTEGEQVPIWIVDWSEFQGLMENESVTLPEIEGLNPVKAVAQQYEEYLSPRMHEHEVIIEAAGVIPDTDQQFTFNLTHRGDQIESITLDID